MLRHKRFGFYCFHTGILCICIAIFGACKKEGHADQSATRSHYELINTGSIWDISTQTYRPCYWRNEEIQWLELPEAKNGFAYGLQLDKNDMYIAGSFENAEGQTLPCYWKNNEKINLPTNNLFPFTFCTTKDIIVRDHNTYILGSADWIPVLWIIDAKGGIKHRYVDSSFVTQNIRSRSATFEMADGKLYIGGDKRVEVNNGYESQVGYWTIDAALHTNWHIVEDHLAYATAFNLVIANEKIFITGERSIDFGGTTFPTPALWNSAGNIPLSGLDNLTAYRLGEVHTDRRGNLLLNVFDFVTHKALILSLSRQGEVLKRIEPIIPGDRSYCSSIAVNNDTTAFVGYTITNSGYSVWSYSGNKLTTLQTPPNGGVIIASAEWKKLP